MKTIQLLLTENVDNLGIVGDVVKVKPGYARNYLVPFGLATEPSDGNIKRLAERRAQVEAELKTQRTVMEKVLEKLADYELTIERHANEQGVLFGGVSQHDIAEALREAGFAIDDRAVRIGIQIKRLDSYEIPITLAADLKTEIKLWVVSDRPMETEDQDDTEQAQDEGESPQPQAAADDADSV
jgi:large subunit ribosomal protein L9